MRAVPFLGVVAVEGFSQYDNILIIWRDKTLAQIIGVTAYFAEVKKALEFIVALIFFYLGIAYIYFIQKLSCGSVRCTV